MIMKVAYLSCFKTFILDMILKCCLCNSIKGTEIRKPNNLTPGRSSFISSPRKDICATRAHFYMVLEKCFEWSESVRYNKVNKYLHIN